MTLRQGLIRIFIVGWMSLTFLGALSHSFVPELEGVNSRLARFFPFLRYGHVMFKDSPTQFSLYWVAFSEQPERFRSLDVLNPTPSIGYSKARAVITGLFDPNYISYLCANREEAQGAIFEERRYNLEVSRTPVTKKRGVCRNGQITRE